MKKHCFNIIMLVLCALFLAGCAREKVSDTTEDEENSMPSIVFSYTYTPEKNIYMVIDKYGDVYSGKGETFCNSTTPEKMELYETFIEEPDCEKIGSVDMEELQQKYELLQVIERFDLCACIQEKNEGSVKIGEHIWEGYCYDEEGYMISILLHEEGESTYTSEDSLATELAEWMKEIQKKYDVGEEIPSEDRTW